MLDRVRIMSNIDEFCQRMSVYAIKKMNILRYLQYIELLSGSNTHSKLKSGLRNLYTIKINLLDDISISY